MVKEVFMLFLSEKMRTWLNVAGGVLWLVLIVTSFFPGKDAVNLAGLIAAAFLMGVYFILGTTVNNKIGSKVPLVYPILFMVLFWMLSFIIAYATKGQKMDLIFGLHPGAFWPMLLFWIGSLLTGTLGYFLYFDKYLLSDKDWEEFMEEVSHLKKLH